MGDTSSYTFNNSFGGRNHEEYMGTTGYFKLLYKPQIYPKSIIVNLIVSSIFFTIASQFGIIAFCIFKVINDVIYTIVQVITTSRALNFKVFELFSIVKHSFIASFFMAISVGGVLVIFSYSGYPINIPIISFIILTGLTSYFLTHYIYDKIAFLKFISELKSIVNPM